MDLIYLIKGREIDNAVRGLNAAFLVQLRRFQSIGRGQLIKQKAGNSLNGAECSLAPATKIVSGKYERLWGKLCYFVIDCTLEWTRHAGWICGQVHGSFYFATTILMGNSNYRRGLWKQAFHGAHAGAATSFTGMSIRAGFEKNYIVMLATKYMRKTIYLRFFSTSYDASDNFRIICLYKVFWNTEFFFFLV